MSERTYIRRARRRPTGSDEANLSESLRNYLKTLLILEHQKSLVRVKDVADHLQVGLPSVVTALRRLSRLELIRHRPYKVVELTEAGKDLARRILQRTAFLSRFMQDVLGLDPEASSRNAHALEHVVSWPVMDRMAAFHQLLSTSTKVTSGMLEEIRQALRSSGPGRSSTPVDSVSIESLRARPLSEGGWDTFSPDPSEDRPVLRLNELEPGRLARVVGILPWAPWPQRQRLIEQGVLPGEPLELLDPGIEGGKDNPHYPMIVLMRGQEISFEPDEVEVVLVFVE